MAAQTTSDSLNFKISEKICTFLEEACARARNRWQNNLFLINVFIWFLSNPEYFICFTNIKFILEHLFINLSVLEIYYFCPILKKSK